MGMFFNRKPKQPRNPDGTFGSPNGDSTVAARSAKNNMAAVADTLKSAFDLTNTIQEQALKNMEMKTRYRDMVDDLEDQLEADGDGELSFEKMAMQVIMAAMQNKPQATQDPFTAPGDPSMAYAMPPSDISQIPQAIGGIPDPVPQAGGVERLNQVIKALNKIPDKVISEQAIDAVCKHEGIEKRELKGVIKKLAPVIK